MADIQNVMQSVSPECVPLRSSFERFASENNLTGLACACHVNWSNSNIAFRSILVMMTKTPCVDAGGLLDRVAKVKDEFGHAF